MTERILILFLFLAALPAGVWMQDGGGYDSMAISPETIQFEKWHNVRLRNMMNPRT